MSAPPAMSKAEFVRSREIDLPMKDVIDEGRKLGLQITEYDVHGERSRMRKRAEKDAQEKKRRGKQSLPKTKNPPGYLLEKTYRFLEERLVGVGAAPSRIVAAEALGVRPDEISKQYLLLRQKGLIGYEPKKPETTRILAPWPGSTNGARSRSLPPLLPAKPPASPRGPDYLERLKTDVTARLGQAALNGDPELEDKTRAVKAVLLLLENKSAM